jgi:hypothetical protein
MSEDAETYGQLVNPQPTRSLASRVAKGAIGLASITAVGWLWQRIASPDRAPADRTPADRTPSSTKSPAE